MKKKIVAVVLASVLVLSLGMTALAAGSSSTSNTTTTAAAKTEEQKALEAIASGVETAKEVTVGGETYTVAVKPVHDSGVNNGALATAAASGFANASVLKAVDVVLVNSKGEIVHEFNGNNVTLAFTVPGVVAGQKIVAIHQKTNGQFETLNTVVGNGTITVVSASLSPIVFVSYGASSVSPKTGQVISIVAILALICVAGAAVTAKKAFR